jgi:Phage integrase, N-terminal SAM-like domain
MLKEYGEKWLPSRAKELKPRTLDHYAQVLRDHVYPALGSRPVRDLTRPMLKAWLGEVKRAGLRLPRRSPWPSVGKR